MDINPWVLCPGEFPVRKSDTPRNLGRSGLAGTSDSVTPWQHHPEVVERALEEFFASKDDGRQCAPDAYNVLFANGLLENISTDIADH
jgi:hypothetical protein